MRHVHFGRTRHRYAQFHLVECRCGARRSLLAARSTGYASLEPGWPRPDAGWVAR